MKKTCYLLFIIMVLSNGLISCAPSESVIQTAIAGTQAIESAVKQQTAEVLQAATPTQTPHIIEVTPTLKMYKYMEIIDFILYNAETKPDIDVGPIMTPRPLPVLEKDNWVFNNRKKGGVEIRVKVVEKTDEFNLLHISTGQREYEIKVSRGGIIFFFLDAPGWVEWFLFSPDIGKIGSPISCKHDINQFFCYYPSSLIQVAVLENGTMVKQVEETKGWCTKYENLPFSRSIDEQYTVDTYRLPNKEYYTWTEDNCPYCEITEITQ